MNSLQSFFSDVENRSKFSCELGEKGGYLNFRNSGQRGSVKEFTISLTSVLSGLKDIRDNLNAFSNLENYVEGSWRDAGAKYFSDLALNSIITVQTKPCFTTFSKIINWANENSSYDDNQIDLSKSSLDKAILELEKLSSSYTPKSYHASNISKAPIGMIMLAKPFLLLAGISGTGKSRFVREQASSKENFCSISVRPDWHEPSDLLGYVSRLTGTVEYSPTDALSFIVQAWANAWDHSNTTENELAIVDPSLMETFWLCLDEMNLAPVEQYFADYLSVIESRKWAAGKYTCDPLLKASAFKCLEEAELKKLRKQLGVEDSQYDNMWQYFSTIGIPVPPNLIVAGTVNMDETTHGFSRKVIDRALTIDFGKFFPNDFDHYLKQKVKPKAFTFPVLSEVNVDDLANITADPKGEKTIQFCKNLNEKLKDSSFELAFRALNELLISLVCVNPKDEAALQAVWDDFLMTKVLPRIEGDRDKLSVIGSDETILSQLSTLVTTHFAAIQTERPDFFREKMNGDSLTIPCRSHEKIRWMEKRLETNGFTAFWP